MSRRFSSPPSPEEAKSTSNVEPDLSGRYPAEQPSNQLVLNDFLHLQRLERQRELQLIDSLTRSRTDSLSQQRHALGYFPSQLPTTIPHPLMTLPASSHFNHGRDSQSLLLAALQRSLSDHTGNLNLGQQHQQQQLIELQRLQGLLPTESSLSASLVGPHQPLNPSAVLSPSPEVPAMSAASLLATSLNSLQAPTAMFGSATRAIEQLQQHMQSNQSSRVLQGEKSSSSLGTADLHAALRQLPADETDAYFKAVRVVPDLVATESDPLKFFRCFGLNAKLVASKIALYWKRRVTIFGEAKAFLPMNLTSDGALEQSDRDFVATGFGAILPPDKKGSTVFCFDSSRRLDHSRETRLRSIFYLGQVVAENPVSQTDGVVVVGILSDPKNDSETPAARELFLNTFPLKIKAIHVINHGKQAVDALPLREGFLPFVMRIASNILRSYPTYVHSEMKKHAVVAALAEHGITRKSIPKTIGGLWSYCYDFIQWLNDRTLIERRRHILPVTSLAAAPATTPEEEDDQDRKIPAIEEIADFGTIGQEADRELQEYRHFILLAIEQIPQHEKKDLLEAMQQASISIQENEVNMEWFLIVEELNFWLAAKRLARYWQLRSAVFGKNKYCSLDQTGEGALRRSDLAALGSGFLNILPHDSRDCSVIWIDSQRIPAETTQKVINRCLFYMFGILAENEHSQTHGATLIYMLRSDATELIDIDFLYRLVQCLPVHFKAAHVLNMGPTPTSDLQSKIDFADETYVCSSTNKAVFVDHLKEVGFQPSRLPKKLQGQWGFEKFVQWQELRTRSEWTIPLGLSGRDFISSESGSIPAIRPYSALSALDKKERQRRLNVIHSRRNRDRVKVEIDVLEERVTELRDRKSTLAEENKQLEFLLASARGIISEIAS